MGAPIIIKLPPNVSKPVDIAILEFEKGVLPITVRRRLPDDTYKDIPLLLLMKEKVRGKEEKRR